MKVTTVYDSRGETNIVFADDVIGDSVEVLPPLSVHGHVRTLTGDRLAIVSALLLGNALSGSLAVGRPVSIRVVTAIRRFLSDDSINFPHATNVPLSVHSGSVELVVSAGGLETMKSPSQHGRRRLLFHEMPTHSSSGRLFTFDRMVVSTNSWIYSSKVLRLPVGSIESSLAVPVLMAQDLSVSKITMPSEMAHGRAAAELRSLQRLLESTELKLDIMGDTE